MEELSLAEVKLLNTKTRGSIDIKSEPIQLLNQCIGAEVVPPYKRKDKINYLRILSVGYNQKVLYIRLNLNLGRNLR